MAIFQLIYRRKHYKKNEFFFEIGLLQLVNRHIKMNRPNSISLKKYKASNMVVIKIKASTRMYFLRFKKLKFILKQVKLYNWQEFFYWEGIFRQTLSAKRPVFNSPFKVKFSQIS